MVNYTKLSPEEREALFMEETQDEQDKHEMLQQYPGNAYIYKILWVEEPRNGWKAVSRGEPALPMKGEWRAFSPGFPYGYHDNNPLAALADARKIVERMIKDGFKSNN